jgi:hypothetical protein
MLVEIVAIIAYNNPDNPDAHYSTIQYAIGSVSVNMSFLSKVTPPPKRGLRMGF